MPVILTTQNTRDSVDIFWQNCLPYIFTLTFSPCLCSRTKLNLLLLLFLFLTLTTRPFDQLRRMCLRRGCQDPRRWRSDAHPLEPGYVWRMSRRVSCQTWTPPGRFLHASGWRRGRRSSWCFPPGLLGTCLPGSPSSIIWRRRKRKGWRGEL